MRTPHSSAKFVPRFDSSDGARDRYDPASDEQQVAQLLGREPSGSFSVVVRRADGSPVVIENAPLLEDGRPMPTRYWLVDAELRNVVSTLESEGGVRRAREEVDELEISEAHARYAAEREAHLPSGHKGPSPSGGVGGTRTGVKCLHAHIAWFLAGGDDPVGRWVTETLDIDVTAYTRTLPRASNETGTTR